MLFVLLVALQLPSPGQVGATVNGALDVRVARPELDAPAAASVARRGGDPVRVEADASVRVRKGARCAWEGRTYAPVERDGAWWCDRPKLIEGP